MPRTLELHGLLGTLPDVLQQGRHVGTMKLYQPPNPEPFKTIQMIEQREPMPSVPMVCSSLLIGVHTLRNLFVAECTCVVATTPRGNTS